MGNFFLVYNTSNSWICCYCSFNYNDNYNYQRMQEVILKLLVTQDKITMSKFFFGTLYRNNNCSYSTEWQYRYMDRSVYSSRSLIMSSRAIWYTGIPIGNSKFYFMALNRSNKHNRESGVLCGLIENNWQFIPKVPYRFY